MVLHGFLFTMDSCYQSQYVLTITSQRVAGEELRKALIQLQADDFLKLSSTAQANPTITIISAPVPRDE